MAKSTWLALHFLALAGMGFAAYHGAWLSFVAALAMFCWLPDKSAIRRAQEKAPAAPKGGTR